MPEPVPKGGLCVYCGSQSGDLTRSPTTEPGWLEEATAHAPGCRWIATRGYPDRRAFPVLAEVRGPANPSTIPWEIADLAYREYARRYGHEQSLARMAERGGFAIGELDEFLPDWRHRLSLAPQAPAVGERK